MLIAIKVQNKQGNTLQLKLNDLNSKRRTQQMLARTQRKDNSLKPLLGSVRFLRQSAGALKTGDYTMTIQSSNSTTNTQLPPPPQNEVSMSNIIALQT